MPAPVRVAGGAAWQWGLRFGLDPLTATRRAFAAFGPFVVLAEALPFVTGPRAVLLNVPLVLTAGATFNRELLSDPETWRGSACCPAVPGIRPPGGSPGVSPARPASNTRTTTSSWRSRCAERASMQWPKKWRSSRKRRSHPGRPGRRSTCGNAPVA